VLKWVQAAGVAGNAKPADLTLSDVDGQDSLQINRRPVDSVFGPRHRCATPASKIIPQIAETNLPFATPSAGTTQIAWAPAIQIAAFGSHHPSHEAPATRIPGAA
jgi:hypothetical protein